MLGIVLIEYDAYTRDHMKLVRCHVPSTFDHQGLPFIVDVSLGGLGGGGRLLLIFIQFTRRAQGVGAYSELVRPGSIFSVQVLDSPQMVAAFPSCVSLQLGNPRMLSKT